MTTAPEKFACKLAGAAFTLALLAASPLAAQNQGGNNNGSGNGAPQMHQSLSDVPLDGPVGGPIFQERRLRQLSIATHKSMVSDTDKLLELATELSNEIGTTNPRSFTPDQLRKIAQIEKLAHSVKDKMRITVQGPQDSIEGLPDLPHVPH